MHEDNELNNLEKYLTAVENSQPPTEVEQSTAKSRVWRRVSAERKGFWGKLLLPLVVVGAPLMLVLVLFITGVIVLPGHTASINTATTNTTTTPPSNNSSDANADIDSTLNSLDKESGNLDADLKDIDAMQTSLSDLNTQY